MNTKLTLTIEQAIIEKAKDYARSKRQSLSDIIENYLKLITEDRKSRQDLRITPIVKSLKGSFSSPKAFDYKSELASSLSKKYKI